MRSESSNGIPGLLGMKTPIGTNNTGSVHITLRCMRMTIVAVEYN